MDIVERAPALRHLGRALPIAERPRPIGRVMPRRMADEDFRREQWEHRFDPHIAPVNALVDRLSDPDGREWMPYVAPMHGGTNATVLSLLRSPRPATQRRKGSGFLSVENDDRIAEQQWHLFHDAGIDPAVVLPWNAHPWYIDGAPSAAELEAGVAALARLIAVAPALQVAILQGRVAKAAWRQLLSRFPETARGIKAVPTIRPGRKSLMQLSPAVRAEGAAAQVEAFRLARQILG
jgi:hypothetical protein